jgi:histone deacetylase complex regulatory component SIN3
VLADSRSQELFELLKRDRALQVPTIQDQLNSRRFAENLLGPDENIFRIDWVRFSLPSSGSEYSIQFMRGRNWNSSQTRKR